MKLKNCLLIAAFLFTGLNVSADELISIFLSNSENSPVKVEIDDVSSIKFNKTALFVGDKEGVYTEYSLSDIKKIVFEKDETSIESINVNASKIDVYPNPVKNGLTIEGVNEFPETDVLIFSLTGTLVARHSQWNGEKIDVSHLAAGIYFVKINSTTLKFVKQ